MTSPSVSFRISRHTQDLAETVHALSQRLVTLEQRLLGLEDQLQALREQPRAAEESEAASLAPIEAHIERLLQDCRQLLVDQPGDRSAFAPPSDQSGQTRMSRSESGAAERIDVVSAKAGEAVDEDLESLQAA